MEYPCFFGKSHEYVKIHVYANQCGILFMARNDKKESFQQIETFYNEFINDPEMHCNYTESEIMIETNANVFVYNKMTLKKLKSTVTTVMILVIIKNIFNNTDYII